MDYGKLVGESFTYAKEGLAGNVVTWILLIILSALPLIPVVVSMALMIMQFTMTGTTDAGAIVMWIIIAVTGAVLLSSFYEGYLLKILRDEKKLPAVSGFGTLFTDGLRYNIIRIIYLLPAIIVFAIAVGGTLLRTHPATLYGGPGAMFSLFAGLLAGVLVSLVLACFLGLFAIIGIVRFARTGRMSEAFNFGAILGTIGGIGWVSYIAALLIIGLLAGLVVLILGGIPNVGGLLQLVLFPFLHVVIMRYICLVYDSAGTA